MKDLSNLYYLLVQATIDENADLPSGKKGYYFAENGFQSWKNISEEFGKSGKKDGVFETDKVTTIELQEVADKYYSGDLRSAESVLGSKYVFQPCEI